MTDQLRQALKWFDRNRPGNDGRSETHQLIVDAARAWLEFPTDAQVLAAAKRLYDHAYPTMVTTWWDQPVVLRTAYLNQARAALEAAREVEKS